MGMPGIRAAERGDGTTRGGVSQAMRPGHRRRLPETPEGQLLHWLERAKAHSRAKVEHPFPVIKQQFGFRKTKLRGKAKNHCEMMVLAALANLFVLRKRLVVMAAAQE